MIIGPESTGKSTLSAAIAGRLAAPWVPEYARQYLEALGRPYTAADLLEIARGQLSLEEDMAAQAGRYLICDTDLYVLKVWSEAKYGYCHPYIMEQIAMRKYDLYLLTYTDIAWEDDPLREHAAPYERHYFYHQYRDIVMNSGVPWADIRGTQEQRVQQSLTAIRHLNH